MSATREMDLDSFLGYETRSKFSSKRLGAWKKRGSITTALHTRAPIVVVWQHPLPRVVEVKGERGTSLQVWGGDWNCLESEEVLTLQYKRDYDTGERKLPPQLCPTCILVETVRDMIENGSLPFCEPVFRWEGDDPKQTQTITAAGLVGLYGSTKLTEEQKEAMRIASIRATESWKESMNAKRKFLFVVVDIDKPKDGVQVALQTTALGERVQEEITKAMVRDGKEAGNPCRNPYPIRWIYDEHAASTFDKYSAMALGKWRDAENQVPWIDAQIRDLIESEPPEIGPMIAPGNVVKLREQLESHALVELPWADIFAAAEAQAGDSGSQPSEPPESEPADEPAPEVAPDPEPSQRASQPKNSRPKAPPIKSKAAPAPEPEPEPSEAGGEDDNMCNCDKCGEPMRMDEFTCPNHECKAKYDPVTCELILPSRSKAKPPKTAEQKAADKTEKKAAKKAEQKKKDADLWKVDESDDLPF